MDDRRGSITVSALVGTGAATLGLALFGIAGVGSDLRAADAARPTTPVVTQDLRTSLSEEQRSPKWDGHSPLATPCAPAPSGTTGGTDRSPQATTPTSQQEL